MTIRRIFYLALIHFIIMVCFPHLGGTGFSFGIISFFVWSGIAIAFGIINAILMLDKWLRYNSLVTAVIVIGGLLTMLLYLPQENKIAPVKQLMYADFPGVNDIKKGLSNFGIHIDKAGDWVDGAKGGVKTLKDGQNRADKALKALGE